METIRSIILIQLALIIVGALLSLPMLLPPLRKWARRNQTNRRISIIIFGTLTFVLLFWGATWFLFEALFAFGVELLTYQGESFDNGGGRFYDEALGETFVENKQSIKFRAGAWEAPLLSQTRVE